MSRKSSNLKEFNGSSAAPCSARTHRVLAVRARWTVGECVAFVRDMMLLTFRRHGGLPSADDRRMAVRVAAFVQSLVSSGRQAFCALRGHELLLHFEPDRLSLRCLVCGAETPGWQLDVRSDLRLDRPRVVIKATMRSEGAASRPVRNRHEPEAASPAPRAA
jgi:hypothetical protein